MADAALFEFLHTEMVAELWAHHSDPGPGAAPGDAGLQRGAGRPQVPLQRLVGCRVPEADGQPPHQSPGDLRPAGQQLPPPHPDGCGSAVSRGSPQVPGLHLRPPARCPQHPGHQEPGHRLRGILAHL
ncbi:trafficking protein particle complex subunit 6A isoform X5 [Canis lupus baileyi]|uniref:Trafficking protein particle complex subunit 6A n=2 Tax=Canis lupus familiaris TaxID=9615 RepID=A0A8C0M5D4_CANLF|nr:trafficking protein particle complex subunit 6A isoform X3 [Canis lupus dingo]|eukprot:XP_013975214.2 trafficking protein particle complex subunit 6A isoform X2 [Canis lupus familiaris]